MDEYKWLEGLGNTEPKPEKKPLLISDINRPGNIKKYGNTYKLTLLKCLGAEVQPVKDIWEKLGDRPLATQKMDCNISRSKSRIFELAMCNNWDYFVTCTLDQAKYKRDDLETFRKDLAQFIRDQRKKWKCDIKYLFIPELHADGVNWHMHGLVGGLREEMLSDFIVGVHPIRLIEKGYRNWGDYANRFGFISLGAVRSSEGVAKYATKYITKDVAKNVQDVGSRMFYSTQGLQSAETVKKGSIAVEPLKWDFENDYVKILWIKEHEVNKYIQGGIKVENY